MKTIISIIFILSIVMVGSACNPSEADLERIEELKNETMRKGKMVELFSLENKAILNEMSKESYKEDFEDGTITKEQYDGVVSAYDNQTAKLNELKCLLYCECEEFEALSGVKPISSDRIAELQSEIYLSGYGLNDLEEALEVVDINIYVTSNTTKYGASEEEHNEAMTYLNDKRDGILELMCLMYDECDERESTVDSDYDSIDKEIKGQKTEDLMEESPGFGIVLTLSALLLLRRRE